MQLPDRKKMRGQGGMGRCQNDISAGAFDLGADHFYG